MKKKRSYLDQAESGLTEHQKNRVEQQKKILVRVSSLKDLQDLGETEDFICKRLERKA